MNHNAIRAIYPNVVTIIGDTSYDNSGDEVTIDEAQVNAWVDPNAYKYKRAEAYKPLAEQLDMQYWDKVNGTNLWKEHIDAVKAAHRKGDKS